MIRAIVFDLDDTLYEAWTYIRSGFTAVADELAARRARRPATPQWTRSSTYTAVPVRATCSTVQPPDWGCRRTSCPGWSTCIARMNRAA